MTFIAFATYGDRAEILTDTASYTAGVAEMGRSSKVLAIPHLDAAVITQGDNNFGTSAKTGMLVAADAASTFDELVESAPEWLTQIHADSIEAGNTPADDESVVFLVGWSPRAGRFRATAFASDDEFAPATVPGLWVMPAPWSVRPSRLEHRRMQRWMAGHPDVAEAARIWWHEREPMPAPRTDAEWLELAKAARTERALGGGFARVIVAGDVYQTTMRRDSITSRKVHAFDDSGEEFLQMVRWSQHPVSLAGACHCGSGKTYGDCCAPKWRDCDCGSGKPFGECCQQVPKTARA